MVEMKYFMVTIDTNILITEQSKIFLKPLLKIINNDSLKDVDIKGSKL